MKFSEKIVVLRKIKKITQDELACAVGVSRQAVYKWECGQSYPEVAKLIELKLLFNISIDDLLDENFVIALPEKKRRRRLPKAEKETVVSEVKENAKVEAPVVEEAPAPEVAPVAAPEVEVAPQVEEPVVEAPKAEEVAPVAAPVVEQSPAPEAAPEVEDNEKKKGFFGRLFGKK